MSEFAETEGFILSLGAFMEVIEDPYNGEPRLPIAERDNSVKMPACAAGCLYGECGGYPSPGCGGCCRCLGGCQDAYERAQTAPHLWTGDGA